MLRVASSCGVAPVREVPMPTQQFGGNAFLSELSGAEMAMFRPHLTLLDLRLDDSLHE